MAQEVILDLQPEDEDPPRFYVCRNCNRHIVLLRDCIRSFRGGPRRLVETMDNMVANCADFGLPVLDYYDGEEALGIVIYFRCTGCNTQLGSRCIVVIGESERFRVGYSALRLNFLLLKDVDDWHVGHTMEVIYHHLPGEQLREFYVCRHCLAHITFKDDCIFLVGLPGRMLTTQVENCSESASFQSPDGGTEYSYLDCSQCLPREGIYMGWRTIRAQNPTVEYVEGLSTLFLDALVLSNGYQFQDALTGDELPE